MATWLPMPDCGAEPGCDRLAYAARHRSLVHGLANRQGGGWMILLQCATDFDYISAVLSGESFPFLPWSIPSSIPGTSSIR